MVSDTTLYQRWFDFVRSNSYYIHVGNGLDSEIALISLDELMWLTPGANQPTPQIFVNAYNSLPPHEFAEFNAMSVFHMQLMDEDALESFISALLAGDVVKLPLTAFNTTLNVHCAAVQRAQLELAPALLN